MKGLTLHHLNKSIKIAKEICRTFKICRIFKKNNRVSRNQ